MGFIITEILELYNDILPEFKVFIISIAWHDTPEKKGDHGFWSLPSTPFLGPALLYNYHILYNVAVCAQFLGQPPGLLLATIKYLNIRYLNILDIQISCVCKHSFLPNNSWSATRSTPADLLYCPQFKYSQQWRSSHQSNFLRTEQEKNSLTN